MLNALKNYADTFTISDINNIRGWHEQVHDKTKYTPDVWRLSQYEWQLVFVYGDEKAGMRWNPVIKQHSHEKCQGVKAFTVDKFTLVKKNLGKLSFPIALEREFRYIDTNCIRGELWAIKPRQFWNGLDHLKENGVQFIRRRVDILVPFGRVYNDLAPRRIESVHHVKAWMYIGESDYWFWQMKQCSPVKEYTPRNYLLQNYREFTQSELNDK